MRQHFSPEDVWTGLRTSAAGLVLLLLASGAAGQWTHRYPGVDGFGHQVYLEGFELPVLGAGPTDPAPSPDGRSIAFAARGWLWLLDLESGTARRLTFGPGIDSRPTWAPDGKTLAFLRDDTRDFDVWTLDLGSGEESALVETPALELDPAYSSDGAFLYYTSGAAGSLDVWRLQIATGEPMRVSSGPGIELRPLPVPASGTEGAEVIYLSKRNFDRETDGLVRENLATGAERTLRTEPIVSQAHPALSPDGTTLVTSWPADHGWELQLLDLETDDTIRLLGSGPEGPGRPGEDRLPLSPAFTADGQHVVFVEAHRTAGGSDHLQYGLWRVPTIGGLAEVIEIRSWDWGEPTTTLEIRTRLAGSRVPLPVRLQVTDAQGHPLLSDAQLAHSDSSSGRVFQYSPGSLKLEVPLGEVRVLATHGFVAEPAEASFRAGDGMANVLDLELVPLWNPRSDGWYAGDHHFHLNYGGSVRLLPEDLVLPMRAEGVDVGTPLLANLHYRFNDREYFGAQRMTELPLLHFGQEVRSHFLGHLGLVGTSSLFWPWYWGPGYELYGTDDRPNHEPLRFARSQGGTTSYMHPVRVPEPFASELAMRSIPINLIPDAVLGDLDTLEIACLWTSEMGTSELWYRLLNVGAPVAASAGTDIMADYYRTMAVGAVRIYVHVPEEMNFRSYLRALRAGRSFVTSGPLLDFRLDGARPGDVAESGTRSWTLRLASATAAETVEVLVNGEVVATEPGLEAAGERTLEGTLELPENGWVLARVRGSDTRWPVMNDVVFAQTSPVWIGRVGSTDPSARRTAAAELLRALEVVEQRLVAGYGDAPIPRLLRRFEDARAALSSMREP